MPNCPPHTYFSAFLDSCIDCPDPLENCYQESKEDSLSCLRSCTARPPKESSGDGDSTALVLKIVLPIVFVVFVAVILFKLYRNYSNRRGINRESVSENPNDSFQLASTSPRNRATESEEQQIDVAATTLAGTAEIPTTVDKHYGSNETLSE